MNFGEGIELSEKNTKLKLFDLEIDVDRKQVKRRGGQVEMAPLCFDLLTALCDGQGQTLTRSELEQALWPGQAIGPDVLKQRVRLLRKALGQTPEGSEYIVTDRSKGYRLASPPESGTRERGLSTSVLTTLVGFFVLAAAAIVYFAEEFSGPTALSVGVEPFASSDTYGPVGRNFADGLSLELATRIASMPLLTTRMLSAGRQSTDLDAIVTGQIAKSAERLHVTVSLADSETGDIIWGQTYDRAFEEIYELQRDITWHIAFMLHNQVDPEASERLKTGPTLNYPAYALFVQALGSNKANNVRAAIDLLDEALELDPEFEAAHTLRDELMAGQLVASP